MMSLKAELTNGKGSGKAWLRALELTSTIAENRDRIFPVVIEELATQRGDAPALLSDRECLSYSELSGRSNQYARWALDQGLEKGETVCLFMPNRPEYLAIWLGITRVGGVVALINTNLTGPSLAHCLNVVAPKHIITAAELADELTAAALDLTEAPVIWAHGANVGSFRRIDREVEQLSGAALDEAELRPVTIEDRALCIYTSGTTGMPKAANVNHARLMQWSHWFAGMMDTQPSDRIYDCLPMYHSVGGVVAPGAVLVGGGSVVIREKFSAGQFWNDVTRWDCTLIQYIGELCRYLLRAAPVRDHVAHRVRMACGNGLARDVWDEFRTRFGIPRIFEFYAATEGGISLFNIEGEHGAIGSIPWYLAHRFSPTLVQFDFEKDEPLRDELGFCVRCGPDQVGEAIGQVLDHPSNIGSRFEGYTNKEASEQRILRSVFEPGDAWVRTGDLMRKDRRGFFYFVDRVGDTYRWKGENVATSEVSEVICAFPGILQANVYGVCVPGADGRAGMAALVTENNFNLSQFRQHLSNRLPSYARPVFLRIRSEMEVTGTFKHTKAHLIRQGYDPTGTDDILYFDHPEHQMLLRLDEDLYQRIQTSEVRL